MNYLCFFFCFIHKNEMNYEYCITVDTVANGGLEWC